MVRQAIQIMTVAYANCGNKKSMKVLDLFAGIGGFSLGLERAGFESVAFCEIEPYCQKVLASHWPEVPIYDDVRQLTADRLFLDGIRPDVITGGFPCQDISNAGQQAGIDGERSGLWSEVARLIDELQPRYAIMENVTALISGDSGRWLGRVLGDLAEIGYDAEWHCIPASAIGANHHRDRVWIMAYPSGG
jgi:DNA (cytosine-5)-methyltransferase 1